MICIIWETRSSSEYKDYGPDGSGPLCESTIGTKVHSISPDVVAPGGEEDEGGGG